MNQTFKQSKDKWLKVRSRISKFGNIVHMYSDLWERKDGSFMRRRKLIMNIKDEDSLATIIGSLLYVYGENGVKCFCGNEFKGLAIIKVYEAIQP